MVDERKSPWNSLEIDKLCAGLLTPILVAWFGFLVQQQLAEQSRSWQSQQRLADRRIQVYDSVRNERNRIYCFIEDVGSWKEDNPETVVGHKRMIDRAMHTNRAIWAADTFQAYLDYISGRWHRRETEDHRSREKGRGSGLEARLERTSHGHSRYSAQEALRQVGRPHVSRHITSDAKW